jgi:hypothetical protein
VRSWRRRGATAVETPGTGIETAAVDALAADELTGRAAIEVEAIAPGIIELSGVVETPEAAERAVAIVGTVGGVRTVLNRLDVGTEREHLAATRRRFEAGDPGLRETRWYGIGVGTGRRRQSRETDPPRRDDSVDMLTREFEAERADERADTGPSGPPPGPEGREL